MIFAELQVGQRFRISGEIQELIKHPKTEIEPGKFINCEYACGQWKNELMEILDSTLVKKVKTINWYRRNSN